MRRKAIQHGAILCSLPLRCAQNVAVRADIVTCRSVWNPRSIAHAHASGDGSMAQAHGCRGIRGSASGSWRRHPGIRACPHPWGVGGGSDTRGSVARARGTQWPGRWGIAIAIRPNESHANSFGDCDVATKGPSSGPISSTRLFDF